jgi:hypothetical protein
MYTLTFGATGSYNCTLSDLSSDSTPCSIASLNADLPSGDVRVTAIYSASFVATGLSVKIASVITPRIVFVQYQSDAPLPAQNLTAICAFVDAAMSVASGGFRCDASSGPVAKARATNFLTVTTVTPPALDAATNNLTAFMQAINDALLANGGPGVSGIVIDVSAPVAPPTDTTNNAPPSTGAIVDPPSSLSGGAIAGIIIGVILAILLVLFIVYFVVIRKGRGTASSSSASTSTNIFSPRKQTATATSKKNDDSEGESAEGESAEEDDDDESEEYDEEDEEEEEEEEGEEESGEEEDEDEGDEDEDEEQEEESEGEEESGSSSAEQSRGDDSSSRGQSESSNDEDESHASGESGNNSDSDSEQTDESSRNDSSEESAQSS